jgi:hypothetical protein
MLSTSSIRALFLNFLIWPASRLFPDAIFPVIPITIIFPSPDKNDEIYFLYGENSAITVSGFVYL